MNIFEVLKSMGFETVPQDFYSLIGVWKNWYDGDVKKFHTYKVFNGQKMEMMTNILDGLKIFRDTIRKVIQYLYMQV